MSPFPGYDADSDDESYPGGQLQHPYSPRGAQYPVHDACEFRDAAFLRSLIFVLKDSSHEGSSSSDSDSDSDSDGSGNNNSDSSSNDSSNNENRSSDDDSSDSDGENHAAAAAAGAMGRQSLTPMDRKDSKPKSSFFNASNSNTNGNGNSNEEAESAKNNEPKPEENISQEEQKPGANGSAVSTTTTSPPVKNNNNEDLIASSPAIQLKQESFSEIDISPMKFGSEIHNDVSAQAHAELVTKKLEMPEIEPSGIDGNPDIVKITPQSGIADGQDPSQSSSSPIAQQLKQQPDQSISAKSNTAENTVKTTATDQEPKKKFHKKKKKKKKKDASKKERKQPEYYCPHDLDEKDEDENTALHVAIQARKLEHIKLLLEAGASPMRKCDGSMAIHTVISVGAIAAHKSFACDAVVVLQKYNPDFAVKDDSQQTPLYLAVVCNLPSVVGIILSDPDGIRTLNLRSDRCGGRPLHAAAKFDMSKTHTGGSGNTGLSPASRRVPLPNGNGSLGGAGATLAASGASSKALLTQILLSTAGIEVDAKNNYGKTPLHIACSRGNWAVVRLLLEAGANPAAADQRGLTPGAMAYKRGIAIPNDLVQTLGPPPVNACIPPARDLMIDPEARTFLICHELCSRHMTCPPITRDSMESNEPPPENVRRLSVLLNEHIGILKSAEFDGCVWEGGGRRAAMSDVLKVHEYSYVEKISLICSKLPDHPSAIANLDADTAVSRWSFEAAMQAAGSVCEAIDRVMAGDFRNAFCAVRPPGHHAGPRGIVRCANDPEGSHGFCLLNNVAIGAAYARSMYRHDGIKKVAIIDFDVHHGNGTEEIIRQLVPNIEKTSVQMSFASGQFETSRYRPWLDETDVDNVFFASTHGYGPRDLRFADHMAPHQGGFFYPASGKSVTTDALQNPSNVEKPTLNEFLFSQTWARMGDEYRLNCCKVINVGLDLPRPTDIPGMQRVEVRDSYRKKILPHLLEFDPDIILISAGFDAHRKDTMNYGYVGMVEEDYEWVTEQLVKVANKCCNGRIVSVLEGGYKIHGGIVSPFARSVASHVRGLVDGGNSREIYDKAEADWESQYERDVVIEKEKRRVLRLDRLSRPMNNLADRRRNFASHAGGENDGVDTGNNVVEDVGSIVGAIDTDAILKEPLSQYLPSLDAAPGSQPDQLVDPDAPSRKRRRNQVDYRELLQQMKQEFGNN